MLRLIQVMGSHVTACAADLQRRAQRITVRDSIDGTRQDLREALDFAAERRVTPHYSRDSLDNINAILDRMRQGHIDGRVVIKIGA